MSDQVAKFLQDNAQFAPAFKFEQIGDKVAGEVMRANVVDGTDLNGNPQRQLVIQVRTDAGTEHAIWVKPGQQLTALYKALHEAKPNDPQPSVEAGDRLAMLFATTEPSKTPGFTPKKVFQCAVRAGTPTAAAQADLFATGGIVQRPPTAPPPFSPPGGYGPPGGEEPFMPVAQRPIPSPPPVNVDDLI